MRYHNNNVNIDTNSSINSISNVNSSNSWANSNNSSNNNNKTGMLMMFMLCVLMSVAIPTATVVAYSRRTPVVEAYQKNKDAVVSISSKYVAEVPVQNPFWFWGENDWPFTPRQRIEVPSLGSGFIINSRGYIVTNAHVIENAQKIEVIMADKSKYPARKVAIDQTADLGILKIDANKPLPTVTLGTSSDLMIGETVLAIGNPFGYQQTLTDGIVSAIHRNIKLSDNVVLPNLIQISAPINPGNSGGPLLNINGELIGINTAIRKAAQGIGFAIPIDTLRKVLPRMLSQDIQQQHRIDLGFKVADASLIYQTSGNSNSNSGNRNGSSNSNTQVSGINGSTNSGDTNRQSKTSISTQPAKGAIVISQNPPSTNTLANYTPGTNQHSANLSDNTVKPGDIITAVNDIRVANAIDFYLAMLDQSPGSTVNLQIYRQDKTTHKTRILTIEMVLHKRPEPNPTVLARNLFGLEIDTLTTGMMQKYQLSGNPGNIVVMGVQNGSPAYKAGIRPGDIILAIGNITIKNIKTLGSCLEQITYPSQVTMLISRSQVKNGFVMIRRFYCNVPVRNPNTQLPYKQPHCSDKAPQSPKQKPSHTQEQFPL